MKIGLSFSRCVRDIWEGRVDSHDVLVIIARTNFNPNDDAQWEGIGKDIITVVCGITRNGRALTTRKSLDICVWNCTIVD